MREAFMEILRTRELVGPGARVLVAVSGGMDSIALLYLLHGCAADLSISLFAAHLDHGIRAESAEDATFVRRTCAGMGVPCVTERVDVPALARTHRRGLEETGREERRRFLLRVAEEQGCEAVALGHHRDDQVETFLHRLIRGTGLTGLAAMRPRSGPFVRPLLDFSRAQIEAYIRSQGLPHVEDASNADPAFTRNRIRHRLLPLLREFNPAVDEAVERLCRQLASEEEYWTDQAERVLDGLARWQGEQVVLDRRRLLSLPKGLRPRVLRRALQEVRGDLNGIEAIHLSIIERLLESGPSQGEADLPRVWAGRRYEQLLLAPRRPEKAPDYALSIDAPGSWELPCGGILRVSLEEEPAGEGPRAAEFSAESLPFPIQVRNFRPGDRISPSDLSGRKKLKDLFIDAKVERELRRRLPLLVREDQILWVPGLRRSSLGCPRTGEGPVLRVELSDCPPVDNWLVKSSGL